MKDEQLGLMLNDTKVEWDITKKKGLTYDPVKFWLSLKKREINQPLTDDELSNYMKTYVICTIIEINKRWPEYDYEGKNHFQRSILSTVVDKLQTFYEKDPPKYFFYYIRKEPTTHSEQIRQHCHIKTKARFEILSAIEENDKLESPNGLKSIKIEKEKIKSIWMNIDEDEFIKPKTISTNSDLQYDDGEISGFEIPDERYLATIGIDEWDYMILGHQDNNIAGHAKSQIQSDVTKFINSFYAKNREQINLISHYFQNISLSSIRPRDIWTLNKLEWKAEEIWYILNRIDQNKELHIEEKEVLYHFYLVICIIALRDEDDTSVLISNSDASNRIIISRPLAVFLSRMVVETFLYFTLKLKKRVFDRIKNPPPKSVSDVTKFSNAIKDKPRDFLKTNPIPHFVFPPAPPKTTNMMMNYEISESIFNEIFDLREIFKSYEEFEDVTKKVISAFESGEFEQIQSPKPTPSPGTIEVRQLLSEKPIELESIFTFLNPKSMHDNKDFDYLTKGAISAVVTEMMSNFRHDDKSLEITLTSGESSLNTEKIAEASASFLNNMIENDFDIESDEVSSIVKAIVPNFQNKLDVPFSVPVPSGTEFDSFRTMVEMNGPMKVSIPFTTQGEKPFWSEEEVLDDKMVQIVDESINNAINDADIGKLILKYL